MRIENMEGIKPGNPFHGDLFRMGTQIGSNVTVMYREHNTEKQKNIVVVDMETGERIKVIFDKKDDKDV